MSTRPLFATLAALALAVAGFAQNAPAAPATAQAQPKAADAVTVQGADTAKTPGSATRDHDTLSVDFPDEEIKTILRNVADLFELNLVVPEGLTGKTSIKLRDVTWRQIFKVVLDPAGYTYVEDGNIIKIITKESLDTELPVTEVIILNNAKVADIKPTITGLIDTAKGGKLLDDARSNALIVTERPSRITHIRSTIEQLDKATDQVMIESKFVEVSDADIRNIGVNWTSLNGMQFGVNRISQTFSRGRDQTRTNGNDSSNGTNTATTTGNNHNSNNTSNTSNTSGTSGSTNNISSTATANGTSSSSTTTNTGATNTSNTQTNTGSQLLPVTTVGAGGATTTTYQVTPINSTGTNTTSSNPATQTNSTSGTTGTSTVTSTVGSTSGTNSATSTSSGTSVTDTIANGLTTTATNAVNSLVGLTNTGTTSRLASAVFNSSDFNIIISALKTQANTKIVSNPTVVTLNNIEAVINVGEEDPIPHYAFNQQTGTYEVTGFDTMKIGVILKVTPQVNARGIINLKLAPEVSQKAGTANFGQAQIPIKATRSVTTQVALKNGNTVGLGGLMTTNRAHGGTKVPVLGDIPLLGKLFSSKAVNDTTSNLLIFVTAKTVNAEGASPEEVFGKDQLDAVDYVPAAKKAGK